MAKRRRGRPRRVEEELLKTIQQLKGKTQLQTTQNSPEIGHNSDRFHLPQLTIAPTQTRAVGTHDSVIMGEKSKEDDNVEMNEVEVEIEIKSKRVEHDKTEVLE